MREQKGELGGIAGEQQVGPLNESLGLRLKLPFVFQRLEPCLFGQFSLGFLLTVEGNSGVTLRLMD